LFWLAVVADLLAIYLQWDTARLVTKPLIVLSLLIYLLQQVNNNKTGAGLLKAALVFSIIGDVALLFENRNPLFFMVGLGSFLLAHVLYILAFNAIRKTYGGARLRWIWVLAVAAYLCILLYTLMPYLGELQIPVIVYAVVLCGMLLMVVHAFRSLYKKPGIICLAGALLFVVSDSVLAINKFYSGFTLSGIVIMFTYACAQYFLVTGAARTLKHFNIA
jgi:uncharacterized membrane protein YhhN